MKRITIEQPATAATVDFLSEGLSVVLTVENGRLRVVARVSHGEESSTWDEHEIEWPITTEGKNASR